MEELAEPGAEDGAGAEVRVAEPWPGYEQLNAKDVIARLSDVDEAELAAVELYEKTSRNRETVVSAVDRELRLRTGSAAAPDQRRKDQANGE